MYIAFDTKYEVFGNVKEKERQEKIYIFLFTC